MTEKNISEAFRPGSPIPNNRLDELFYKALDDRVSPSLICAVGKADRIFYLRAAGYSRAFDDSAPCFDVFPEKEKFSRTVDASYDTMYDMASLSKLISTTCIALKLMENGKLSLSDSLSMYFSDVPDEKKDIRIEHLMTHTSGIPAHFRLDKLENSSPEHPEITILNYPLSYRTGTKVEYSCMGYILLAKILEKITGKPLDVLGGEMVFGPLNMTRTCYHPLTCAKHSFSPDDFAATEYDEAAKKYICGIVHDENARFLNGISGNAGVFSCAEDLCRFASMLSCHGSVNGTEYLKRQTFDSALLDRTSQTDPEQARGLGFQLRGKDEKVSAMGTVYSAGSYGHNGFTGPSLYVDLKSGIYTLILANRVHFTRESYTLFSFRRTFHDAVLSEFR